MKSPYPAIALSLLMGVLPLAAVAQGTAPQPNPPEVRSNPVTPPSPLPPTPTVAPQIKVPLTQPRPPTLDPPALQGGKPAPPGGINDAAARCEALADVQARAQCRDKLARETPVRPAG